MHDQENETNESFVWPPRRMPQAETEPACIAEGEATPTLPLRKSKGHPATIGGGVLTKSEPAAPSRSCASTGRGRERNDAGLLAALRSMLFEAERVWLDVRCPVLKERLDEVGWRPDNEAAYCGRCGQTVGPNESEREGCSHCAGSRPAWRRIVRLGAYRQPLTRLIHEVKFTRWRRLGSDLGAMLGESLAAAIEEERRRRPDLPKEVVVLPVPTTFRRRMLRGIDHSRVIAAAVAKRVDGRILTGVVTREHRPSQLHVQPSERAANMAGAFHPRKKKGTNLSGKLVVVVDDVTTTGATLRGACRAVARAHRMSGSPGKLELWAGVVAVTELERERRRQEVGGSGEVPTAWEMGDEGV